MHKLDIIVPVKNEEDNIIELVKRISDTLKKTNISYRIVIVDDHSTDSTIDKVKALATLHPIKILTKKGKPGKAYSIIEASRVSESDMIAMIDGDLQYPPEVIPEMYELAQEFGISVASRKENNTSFLRKFGSMVNVFVFERLLHGFKVDTQSGLKVFKKEIIDQLSEKDVTGWTLDMPLLKTAQEMGYEVSSVDIEFMNRKAGQSKINFINAGIEIAINSLKLKLGKSKIYHIKPSHPEKVIGAGVAYKGRRFITHTHLPHHIAAMHTFYPWQKVALVLALAGLAFGLYLNAKLTAIVILAVLTFIYLLDFLFNIYVLFRSMHFPPEITSSKKELDRLNDEDLPIYTILCPLYKEAKILPHFVKSIHDLDWPEDKLDVLLLLEEDDKETQEAAKKLDLPDYIKVLVVPHSQPKTKPKACNYGFAHSKGEYVVIYDAEDRPDPDQLKKAYLGFQKSNKDVVCLQSRLNYFNSEQNLLTRLFTAEYSLWFDLILPGLQTVETTIPLGGTSNHFRAKELAELHAWDPFNVTEDCDLGARLFKAGKKTALIDSTTYEEANSKVKSWIKQRSRWIKGYLQTYLVHMRDPIQFVREHKIHALLFHLIIGMRMVFILINPLLWLMTISYFALYKYVGPQIESLYPTVVFYPAVILLVFGNFLYLYNYMIGAAKRGHWSVVKYVLFVPLYWIMTSIAAVVAFYQLFVKPHYWEKTEHGLHLDDEKIDDQEEIEIDEVVVEQPLHKPARLSWVMNSTVTGGGAMIAASILGNFSNFLYNAYLGREVGLEEFGTVSLISSIFALSGIVTGAVGKTVTYKTAMLFGKIQKPVKAFWSSVFGWAALLSAVATVVWVLLSPYLVDIFNTGNVLPFLLFTPAWTFALMAAVNRSFLSGNLKFWHIGFIATIEAASKLGIAIALVELGYSPLVYISIPASLVISFMLTGLFIFRTSSEVKVEEKELVFPKQFFGTSVLTGLSVVAFLSFDVILAKHFLSPIQAGQYALLSLVGKMIFFVGGMFSQFITPIISHGEGANKNTLNTFYKILGASAFVSLGAYLALGVFGSYTVPLLFGSNTATIVGFLPLYGYAIFQYSISSNFINYHQVKGQYIFPVIGFLFALAQIVGIYLSPRTFNDFVLVVSGLAMLQLVVVVFLHIFYSAIETTWRNIVDLAGLFGTLNGNGIKPNKLRILILNWRDTKHVWAGGAEVYIFEIAKRWKNNGHKVTLFCGNDGKSKRNEEIDGVKIVRRGGLYMVYFWAALYYILKFRGKYDVIVDCENAIPFFSPLYSRIQKVLLIHHVHQEVLRKHLRFPFSYLGMFFENKLMPLFYRGSKIVTVSESSKKDIIDMGWAKHDDITVVNPGVSVSSFKQLKKTLHPSFLYLGRLQHYKNIDIAIDAFAKIHQENNDARLTIAVFGESLKYLKNLSEKYGLQDAVDFAGYVSEKEKVMLLARSWAALQPSSFEGWGITVIEANASGTPVIASDTKGLTDSVIDGRTGILVPVRDVEKMAQAMRTVMMDKKYRKKLTINALKWSKNFSWKESAQKFLSIVSQEYQRKQDRQAISSRFATSIKSLF